MFFDNSFYHVFNRGNNKGPIFFNHDNYIYFLKKFDHYLSPFIDVYAFCLLHNHFHFLIRTKNTVITENTINPVSQSFSNFFNSYTKSINKQQNRTGSLFQKNFHYILIEKELYLTRLVYYIHLNPVKHKISKDYQNYPWSSYKIIISNKKTNLKREELLNYFNGLKYFTKFHYQQNHNLKEIQNLILE